MRRERPHGYARYVKDRCGCPVCTSAARAYVAHRRQEIARGHWQPFVNAEPIRQHLEQLTNAGMSLDGISARSGVSVATLRQIVNGRPTQGRPPSRRVRPATAAQLLTVQASTGRQP